MFEIFQPWSLIGSLQTGLFIANEVDNNTTYRALGFEVLAEHYCRMSGKKLGFVGDDVVVRY